MHFNVTEYVILLAKHKQAEVFIKKKKIKNPKAESEILLYFAIYPNK